MDSEKSEDMSNEEKQDKALGHLDIFTDNSCITVTISQYKKSIKRYPKIFQGSWIIVY